MIPTLQAALDDARRALRHLYGDRLVHVVLYGSQARGDAGPESDIDIMVVLDGPFDLYAETKRLVRLEAELNERYDACFSFQPFTVDEYRARRSPFMINVRREGVVL